jgi:hypothetical protein
MLDSTTPVVPDPNSVPVSATPSELAKLTVRPASGPAVIAVAVLGLTVLGLGFRVGCVRVDRARVGRTRTARQNRRTEQSGDGRP